MTSLHFLSWRCRDPLANQEEEKTGILPQHFLPPHRRALSSPSLPEAPFSPLQRSSARNGSRVEGELTETARRLTATEELCGGGWGLSRNKGAAARNLAGLGGALERSAPSRGTAWRAFPLLGKVIFPSGEERDFAPAGPSAGRGPSRGTFLVPYQSPLHASCSLGASISSYILPAGRLPSRLRHLPSIIRKLSLWSNAGICCR